MAELLRSYCSYPVGDNDLDQVAAEKVVKSIEILNIMKAQPARFVVGLDVVDERERNVKEDSRDFHLLNVKVGLLSTAIEKAEERAHFGNEICSSDLGMCLRCLFYTEGYTDL